MNETPKTLQQAILAPSYCPQCGTETILNRRATDEERKHGIRPDADYLAGASHSCPSCGLGYQQAKTSEILKAATKSGGDLQNYHVA